ncbi:16S rRNA (uracil(1498)-N(3))-methyltransferase [Verrucomicrobiales bacterium]|nr:16S rRNA (uracil(1498)-N(3))-methyltransferase [Verrucomicrobiales bacterium]
MPRFYIEPKLWDPNHLVLNGDEFHHCVNVLRLECGDQIVIFNGKGEEITAIIKSISKEEIQLKGQTHIQSEKLKTRICIGQAVPKGKNMDLIIEKSTELGAAEIYPIISERTIIRLNEKDRLKKTEKWQRVAIEACKQSGQNWLPLVNPPQNLKKLFESVFNEFDLIVIASLQEGSQNFKKILSEFQENGPNSVLILIGPEGDYTPSEINFAINAGSKPMSLGPITLRSETAAIYSLSVAAHELL